MKPPLKPALLIATLCCAASTISSQTSPPNVSVPFVGCKADGQVGPRNAPEGTSRFVSIPAETAQKLAYYKAVDGLGVLGPRGWYCLETYGSSGSYLFISPQPIDTKMVFSGKWEGFTGPAIQISDVYGDTSGRFRVAETIARVFPAHMGFTRKVIAEGIESAKDFPQGPYPNDKLTYRSKEVVEYQTPANTKGLGTDSRLKENSIPIDGVAMLVSEEPNFKEPSLIFLAVRLPPDQAGLTHVIIQQTEKK